MRLVIVTGMSGAGKSTAMKMLEDAQYFCVDNLPIQLVGKFVSLVSANKGEDVQNAAIGLDVRSGRYLEGLEEVRFSLSSLVSALISSRLPSLSEIVAPSTR